MIENITENVYKISHDSNVYLIKDRGVVIDTGFRMYRNQIKKELTNLIDLRKVKTVIFTHLHMDHAGNFDLFPNAEFFASEEAIKDLKNDKAGTLLDPMLAAEFNVDLRPLKKIDGFKIIKTPGHTRGSVCLYYQKEGILFSGDTLFNNGIGRTDLPTSDESKMEKSLGILKDINYNTLCPGHDY